MLRQIAKRTAAAAAVPSSSKAAPSLRTPALLNAARSASSSSASTSRSSSRSSSPASSSSSSKNSSTSSRSSSFSTSASSLHSTSSDPEIPSASSSAPLLQVTTLPNGVKVATDGTPGHFVAAGVYVAAGSRFEHAGNSGSSHMIDRLAFKSTSNRTGDEMTQEIESLGGQFLASSSREVIMYQASSYTHSLPAVLSLLSDTILHPTISADELEHQRQSAQWEIAEITSKPEMFLPELLYEVAFQNNTLGNPLLIRPERLEVIDTQTIENFRRNWFRPDRMVVAGAGVEHEQLVELVKKQFGHLEPSAKSASSSTLGRNIPTHLLHSQNASHGKVGSTRVGKAPYATTTDSFSGAPTFEELANAGPVYTGGSHYLTDGPAESLEFSHLYVGYEGLSIHDPDVYALATLQMLLGGGSSFSAGGPGKGMFSRLYTSLLNRYHDIEHASAFHHCYLDTGLFAMCISVNPHFIGRAPGLIAEQLDSLMDTQSNNATIYTGYSSGRRGSSGRGISGEELSRAKNQLKSSLVMALESRMVQVEDLGRQVLAHGNKIPAEEMLRKIDEVQLADLQRVARRIFRPHSSPQDLKDGEKRSGEPTILAAGRLEGLKDVRGILKRYGLAP